MFCRVVEWQFRGMISVRVLERGIHLAVESMCSAEWVDEGSTLELTLCLVELGEGVVTDVTISEEHTELTSAQMSPDVFGVDYQIVSEEQEYIVSPKLDAKKKEIPPGVSMYEERKPTHTRRRPGTASGCRNNLLTSFGDLVAGDLVAWRYQGKTCLGGEIIVRGTRINLEPEDWWYCQGRGPGDLETKTE